MANKKINQLVSKTAILSTDLFGIGDATTGQLFKKTIAELQAAIGGAVISVNGLVGTVVLDTDDVQELASPTNKYFTDARARGAISLTVTGNSGASTYSSGTGVLNVPTYTLAGLGGITASFLSGTSGISYNSSTGVISYSGTVYTDASIRALLSGGTGISYNSTTGAISYSGTVYTDSSIRALISMTTTGTSGASTYNNTTGVINVPNYTLAGLGGISLTSLSGGTGITYNNTTGAISYSGTVYTDASVRALISASGAVSYNNTTGVISLTSGNLTEATSSVLTITGGTGAVLGSGTSIQVKQATTSVSGFLSSTDWNTFNGKASALSGTTNYHAKFTSSTTIGNSLIFDNGTNIGINTSSPRTSATGANATLDIKGGIYFGSSAAESCTINNDDSMIFNIDADNTGTVSFFRWATNTTLETGGSELMRLNESGNLGLSITPGAWASGFRAIQLSSSTAIWSGTGSTGAAYFTSNVLFDGARKYINSTFASEYQQSSGNHFFLVAPSGTAGNTISFTTAMQITNSGNFLVGSSLSYGRATISAGVSKTNTTFSETASALHLTTSESDTPFGIKFFLIGNSTGSARRVEIQTGEHNIANDGNIALQPSGGNILMGTSTNNGERLYVSGTIRATGTITANSDIRIKSNITKIENALEKVGQISGYTYNTDYDDKRHGGVIAQEIDKVFPEIVNTGNDGLMGVEYGNISALLIEAIKEQNIKIKNLETLLASK